MYEVEHLLPVQNHLGESPVWNPDERRIYWVDIRNSRIHRFQPATDEHQSYPLPVPVTSMGRCSDGCWIVSTRDGFGLWRSDSNVFENIAAPEADREDIRFNDGAVDPLGRFWAGTMNDRQPENPDGRLYRLDPDGSLRVIDSGFTICNGIGWSPDCRTMYFTDTLRSAILAYDFDPFTGEAENRRPFIDVPRAEGHPDGLAVDSEGFIWSAHWGSSKVRRYDPQGKCEREILFPVTNVSSCAFGGEDLKDLYVTTAWEHLSAAERQKQPLAGDLFRVRTEIPGRLGNTFRNSE